MGATPAQFLTITSAELTLENNVDLRVREFGSDYAQCIAAAQRSVKLNFELFELADTQTAGCIKRRGNDRRSASCSNWGKPPASCSARICRR